MTNKDERPKPLDDPEYIAGSDYSVGHSYVILATLIMVIIIILLTR